MRYKDCKNCKATGRVRAVVRGRKSNVDCHVCQGVGRIEKKKKAVILPCFYDSTALDAWYKRTPKRVIFAIMADLANIQLDIRDDGDCILSVAEVHQEIVENAGLDKS